MPSRAILFGTLSEGDDEDSRVIEQMSVRSFGLYVEKRIQP